ncbi:MAG: rhomboid family intramembrane serine protease [Nanoarchaeota archaeon]
MRLVTLKLMGLCVLMYFAQLLLGITDLVSLHKDTAYHGFLYSANWWQYLTSIFAHGSAGHLASNLIGLLIFGLILEGRIGSKRLLWLFLTSGLVVNILSPYPSSLGASGAIFAIMGALVALRPFMIIWLYWMPMPMIIAGAIWAVSNTLGALGGTGGIGYIAHLIGLGIGLLFGLALRRQLGDKRKLLRRGLPKDPHLERALDDWERQYMGR